MRDVICSSPSSSDTRAIAALVARALRGGDVVILNGDLGAGKTCFVQGAAAELGVKGPVQSPSFVLVREYAGRLRIVHADVYRLNNLQELFDLGDDALFDDASVTFIEWGDAVEGALPDDRLEVSITRDDDDTRHIVLRARGDDWAARLESIARALPRVEV